MLSFGKDEVNTGLLSDFVRTEDGVTYVQAAPAPASGARVSQLVNEMERAAGRLEEHVEALRKLVELHEPIELISSVAIPTHMEFGRRRGVRDDAGETLTWPAKVEYLLGLALSGPPGTRRVPAGVTEEVMHLLDAVFVSALARNTVEVRAEDSAVDEAVAVASHLLRAEHIFDRMPGYAVHLQQIDAEVFDRHRSYYVTAIGFSPGDVARVVRRRVAAGGNRVNDAYRLARLSPRNSAQWIAAVTGMLAEAHSSRTWELRSLAGDTGVDHAELDAMLRFFSAPFGVQPEFRLPTDHNAARTRPCVALDDGSFFVADPWALLAAVHQRLSTASPDVLAQYRRHRERGHERVVAGALRAVFGGSHVYEQQHYVSDVDGPGEVDVLVTTEQPLVVEAKAAGLTERGRRGRADRVARVAEEVVGYGLTQTARAARYIVAEGGTQFSARQGGPTNEVVTRQAKAATEVVVTFERMDPLTMNASGLAGGPGPAVWAVCAADLLMVAEILDDPAALHHYARTRARMALTGPVVFMESDALGAYLDKRLLFRRDRPADQPGTLALLGYHSAVVNSYFTAMETGRDSVRPTTGVPLDIVGALAATTGSDQGCWVEATTHVMEAPAATWRRLRSYYRRHTAGRFLATESLCVEDGTPALRREGAAIVLTAPLRGR